MRKIGSSFFLIILILALCNCAANPDNLVNGALTEDEMAIPPGRYQIGIDINCQGRVNLDSPDTEPVLISSIVPEKNIYEVLVDGEDGIWFAMSEIHSDDTICRLNPDGSVDWKITYEEAPYEVKRDDDSENTNTFSRTVTPFVSPVVALNGAMIVYVGWDFQNSGNGDNQSVYEEGGPYAYLECVDLEGNVRWRTRPTGYDSWHMRAWRVSDDKIAMVSSEYSFDVYSITDGSFIEQVSVPGWSPLTLTGPILLDDGRWVIHGDKQEAHLNFAYPYIYCVNPDGSYSWKAEYPTWSFSEPVMLSDDNILYYGNRNGLRAINADNGEELWRWWGGMHYVAGILPDGNILTIGTDYEQGSILGLASPEGERLLPIEVVQPINGADDVIIYRDGNVLFAGGNGLTLIDTEGEVLWNIDISEFGVTATEPKIFKMIVNPTSDGGFVIKNHNMDTDDYMNDAIYMFKPQ